MTLTSGSRRAALAAAVLLTLAGAGCAQASPTVAAYVGNEQISQERVEDVAASVKGSLGRDFPASLILSTMIQGDVFGEIARAKGVVITDAERDAAIKTGQLETLASTPAGKDLAYGIADVNVVVTKVPAAEVKAELAKVPVTVNPRYGVYDPATGALAQNQSGSLSLAPPTPGP